MENNTNSTPCLYGRYDLYSPEDIADFFLRNGLNLVAVPSPDCNPDQEPIQDVDSDHIGEYILGHAGFRLDGYWFKSPEEAFNFVISHQFALMGWMAFIANHVYHEEFEKSQTFSQPEIEAGQSLENFIDGDVNALDSFNR